MGWMCVNMLRQYMGQTWADTDTGPQLVSPLTDAVLIRTQQQIEHMSNTAQVCTPYHKTQLNGAQIQFEELKEKNDILKAIFTNF